MYNHYYIYILVAKNLNRIRFTFRDNLFEDDIVFSKKDFFKKIKKRSLNKKLLWYQDYKFFDIALKRDSIFRAMKRKEKIELIQSKNPNFRNLFDDFE